MHKTLLHPDRVRSWAAVSIVAVDLDRAELHLMAGRSDPESKEKAAAESARPAVIPESDQDALLGAFNGGFKTTHGRHGMKIDGVLLVPARKDSCTISRYEDGHLVMDEVPGLGVDIDEVLAAKYPYERAYLPVARLRDGSMWNW